VRLTAMMGLVIEQVSENIASQWASLPLMPGSLKKLVELRMMFTCLISAPSSPPSPEYPAQSRPSVSPRLLTRRSSH
jgi:hypothetical protein